MVEHDKENKSEISQERPSNVSNEEQNLLIKENKNDQILQDDNKDSDLEKVNKEFMKIDINCQEPAKIDKNIIPFDNYFFQKNYSQLLAFKQVTFDAFLMTDLLKVIWFFIILFS